MSFLSGNLWKIATGGAAILAVILSSFLLSKTLENRDLTSQRNKLSQQINDPKTGYVAQLAQARTNEEQLKTAVARQNVAYAELSRTSAARIADSERRLAIAQSATRTLERKLNGFLATGPKGTTLEDRVRDIDDRALKEFLP